MKYVIKHRNKDQFIGGGIHTYPFPQHIPFIYDSQEDAEKVLTRCHDLEYIKNAQDHSIATIHYSFI